MKTKAIVKAHVAERTAEARTICDLCGKNVERRDWYDHSEVEIEARIGSSFPEGDNRTVYRADVCPACFTAKVIPALEAIGVKFYVYDIEEGPLKSAPWDHEVKP